MFILRRLMFLYNIVSWFAIQGNVGYYCYMTEKKQYFIYLLSCPITNEPKYVGQSRNPQKRFKQHCRLNDNLANTKRCNWLKSLIEKELKPIMTILETDLDCYDRAEKKWIKHYKDLGFDLTNGNSGGYDLEHTQSSPRSNRSRGKRSALSKMLSEITRICNGNYKYYPKDAIPRLQEKKKIIDELCAIWRKAKLYHVLEERFEEKFGDKM